MLKTLLLFASLTVLLATATVEARGGAAPPCRAAQDDIAPVAGNAGPTAADATISIPWWTVDSGGASYNAAGSYTLGATAGQADAAVPRTFGVYELRPGFWQPSCAAAGVATTIAAAGAFVSLAWRHSDANQTYQVHRDTTPYFTPADATRRGAITAPPWSFADPEPVIGDPDINHFYQVRATCAAAYVDADRHGEFDFALVPGSS